MWTGYDLPWEEKSWEYPSNFAKPLQIIIEASNGASDYGNKFGEPLISGMNLCRFNFNKIVTDIVTMFTLFPCVFFYFSGFVQSYGLNNGDNVREEFVKPIMFSGGIGYMPHSMIKKNKPNKGNNVTSFY